MLPSTKRSQRRLLLISAQSLPCCSCQMTDLGLMGFHLDISELKGDVRGHLVHPTPDKELPAGSDPAFAGRPLLKGTHFAGFKGDGDIEAQLSSL